MEDAVTEKALVLAQLELAQAYGDMLWDHRQALANWLTRTAATILRGQQHLGAHQFILETPRPNEPE